MKFGVSQSVAGAGVRPIAVGAWTLAAAGAVAIHLAVGALAYAGLSSNEYDADGAGALTIEVRSEFLSPQREFVDARLGPDSEAQQATPQQTPQLTEQKEVALPKDTPTEPEKADRVVAENPAKQPVEDNPDLKKNPVEASDYTPATEAMATPSIEAAKESETSAAPVQGIGDTLRRAIETWQRNVTAHLNLRKVYPGDRDNQTAKVEIEFIVDRMGHVTAATVSAGSGDISFDKAALEWLRRSDPLPPPPPGLVGENGKSMIQPFEFNAPKNSRSARS